jgi:hypothetical protein
MGERARRDPSIDRIDRIDRAAGRPSGRAAERPSGSVTLVPEPRDRAMVKEWNEIDRPAARWRTAKR